MKVTHGQTESGVGLKSSRGCDHANRWWFVWVFSRKVQPAVIFTSCVRRIGWSLNNIVPINLQLFLYKEMFPNYHSKMLVSIGFAVMKGGGLIKVFEQIKQHTISFLSTFFELPYILLLIFCMRF